MLDDRHTIRVFGIGAETIAYDVLSFLSIISILAAFSKTRLRRVLKDTLSRRVVVLCGFSLLYEFKFRLARQMSCFRVMREYGYTLVSMSQLAHFSALIFAIMDAFCWVVFAQRARLRPKIGRMLSSAVCATVTLSAILTVCYLQFCSAQKNKIFLPKQTVQLLSVPLALLFFAVLIFWRSFNTIHMDRASETILTIYVRMITVTFATSCLHIILIMVKTEWTVVHFIHAADGCFFALIAYRLDYVDANANDDVDVSVRVAGSQTSNELVDFNTNCRPP